MYTQGITETAAMITPPPTSPVLFQKMRGKLVRTLYHTKAGFRFGKLYVSDADRMENGDMGLVY